MSIPVDKQWVQITIAVYRGKGRENKIIAYEYRLPRPLWQKWQWVITWRAARVQCQYPRDYVSTELAFFENISEGQREITIDYNNWIAAKAMITKITNAMRRFEENYMPKLFEPLPSDNEDWKKAKAKLDFYVVREAMLRVKVEENN